MPPQFKNMDELTAYLGSLEQKVQRLEEQNKKLQEYVLTMGSDAQKLIPKTSLLSQNFIQRAFAIWGHNFVAQLIISLPFIILYFTIIITALKNLALVQPSLFNFPTPMPFPTTQFMFPNP